MKQLSKGFIGAAVLTAAAASAASYTLTKELVGLAVDRNEPPAMQRAGRMVSGVRRPDAFTRELQEDADRLRFTPHEVVNLLSRDGVVLSGHWFANPNPKRIVLAMHGWRSSWYRDFGMAADFLLDSGCSVLFVEQRGQNGSGGAYMGLGLMERYDCLDWVQWLIRRCGESLPIYLTGISMGATSVLMAAGEELPPCVHGIISDCGFTSPRAISKHVANKNLHIPFELRSGIAEYLFHRRLNMGLDEYSTLDAMRACKVPVLLIHGAADRFVPVSMTKENYEACQAPKELFIVPGADHGMSYYRDREGYENVVEQFWKKWDHPGQTV